MMRCTYQEAFSHILSVASVTVQGRVASTMAAVLLCILSLVTISVSSFEIEFHATNQSQEQLSCKNYFIPFGSKVTLICHCKRCETIEFLKNALVKLSRYYSGNLCTINSQHVALNECSAHSLKLTFETSSRLNNTRWLCRGRTVGREHLSLVHEFTIMPNDVYELISEGQNIHAIEDVYKFTTEGQTTHTIKDEGMYREHMYWVGGGVACVIVVASLVVVSLHMKRKFKRSSDSVGIYLEAVASPEVDSADNSRGLQTSVVHDYQGESQTAASSPENLQPSERCLDEVPQRSAERPETDYDERSDRSDSYLYPHYCEVDEERMVTLPEPHRGPKASFPDLCNSSSSVVTDGRALRDQTDGRALRDQTDGRALRDQTDGRALRNLSDGRALRDQTDGRALRDLSDRRAMRDLSDGRALRDQNDGGTGGDINIPLVAETFRSNEANDTTSTEHFQSQPDHYEHLIRDNYMMISCIKKNS